MTPKWYIQRPFFIEGENSQKKNRGPTSRCGAQKQEKE